MISDATISEDPVAAQVYTVSQAAYALEAQRIGCADFPPLRESLGELRRSGDRFLVFREAGQVVGALSFDGRGDCVVITRLVVRPSHLRRGIARALLVFLEEQLSPEARVSVSTAEANLPAIALYRQLGYAPTGATDSAEGVRLLHLSKAHGNRAA